MVHRLLWSAAVIDYPKDRYEVQVLDDSNDETIDLINNAIAEIRKQDVNMYAVRRPKRIDFKAGALAYGLNRANGDYIAIFDSDFIIPNVDKPQPNRNDLTLKQRDASHQASESS